MGAFRYQSIARCCGRQRLFFFIFTPNQLRCVFVESFITFLPARNLFFFSFNRSFFCSGIFIFLSLFMAFFFFFYFFYTYFLIPCESKNIDSFYVFSSISL